MSACPQQPTGDSSTGAEARRQGRIAACALHSPTSYGPLAAVNGGRLLSPLAAHAHRAPWSSPATGSPEPSPAASARSRRAHSHPRRVPQGHLRTARRRAKRPDGVESPLRPCTLRPPPRFPQGGRLPRRHERRTLRAEGSRPKPGSSHSGRRQRRAMRGLLHVAGLTRRGAGVSIRQARESRGLLLAREALPPSSRRRTRRRATAATRGRAAGPRARLVRGFAEPQQSAATTAGRSVRVGDAG